jgi:serine phosphatase RsbU (regulator of sigma subunit)/anti-sigma regulatory factor (Ser/Thr protein kinase)
VFASDGTIDGVGVVVRDVTAAVVARAGRDRLFERVTRLQAITQALALASTTPDIVGVVVEHVRGAIGADAASLSLIVDDELEVVGADGYSEPALSDWGRFPLAASTPMSECIRTARVVLMGSRAEIDARWPDIGRVMESSRGALAALPLVVDGVAQGAIGLSFDHERTFNADDEDFLTAVATQCAEGLLRARLFESERAAHLASALATDRLAFLAEASDILAHSLDWGATLQRVAALAVPRLADFAAVFVMDSARVETVEITHTDPARIPMLRSLAERWPVDLGQLGLGAVARTGEPLLLANIRPEDIAAGARDPEHADALLAAGFHSLLAVPMRAHGRTTGLIVLGTDAPRALGPSDLTLARELATRAGQALVNADLFRERSHVAATLQASLLPPATPTLPGLEVATRFFAVGEGIDVGGDFYDIFPMGTRAEPAGPWAVVIGDVRGKGTEAASVSGAARHAIRAIALREHSPAAILSQLNEVLLVLAEDDPEPRFCTAALATVQPHPGGASVVLAVGGHPPPLILRADGTTETTAETGTLIGVLDDLTLTDVTLHLRPGDSLVLYTDSVTERHEGDRFFDEDGLASVLSRCTGFTAPVLAERIETAARAFVEDAPRDDLAIVVVRVPESVANAAAATTELPGDTSAPGRARRFVLAALAALGAERHGETAALLTSELVTNAVIHGASPYRIAVEADHGRVRVAVTDGSPVPPVLVEEDIYRVSGRGVRLVDGLADRWGVDAAGVGKTVWFELAP